MDTAPFTLEITQDAPAVFHAPSCCGSLDLRLGCCMDVMKTFPDGYFDLAIVDPPYGIGVNSMNMGSRKTVRPDKKNWDDEIPTPEYFTELRRVAGACGTKASQCMAAASPKWNSRGCPWMPLRESSKCRRINWIGSTPRKSR